MCFLYRQSISIVYESKFKYIYRYFIKIDRCFCGILLSLPLWKCGLKCRKTDENKSNIRSLPLWKCGLKSLGTITIEETKAVTSLVEVWIEMENMSWSKPKLQSLPLWKCGLKSPDIPSSSKDLLSLPLWKCGLKFYHSRQNPKTQ